MSNDGTDDWEPVEDGGLPTNADLRVRLARVEEKQDAQIEKLDYIAEQLDEKLVSVTQKVATMRPQHDRMWIVYKWGKWLLGGMIAGGVTFEITGWL